MKSRIQIFIAEPSIIIRSGIISVLKRLNNLSIDTESVSDIASLSTQLRKHQPDILIVDPVYLGLFSIGQIKSDSGCSNIKIIALQNKLTDKILLQHYDDVISIYDTAETMKEKLTKLINNDEIDNKQELSQREKEIVVCIVKGMTNKQIAETLCLSTHTIITHRRNIANKLQIHSPAGLTIYAIVRKLVEINDVKNTIISPDGE